MTDYNRQYKGFSRKYINGNCHVVLCKCPHCGTLHLEKFRAVPVVMPRRYCPKCEHLRNSDGDSLDVRGTSVRANTAQKHKRAGA
jgi:hypothetical protein